MKKGEFGLFIVRVVLGITFFIHGVNKLQQGIPKTIENFSNLKLPDVLTNLNLPVVQVLAIAVIALEVIGGIALIIGFSTKILSFFFILLMIGAIATVKFPMGFLHGYELDVVLMAMSASLLLSNNQVLALDNLFIEKKKKR